ncbi:MAG: DUF6044 family protein [Lachnospiraceae bacterium]|nr:DUF6044 family protein [Lachnospiraceae bacterium]
MIKGRLKKLLDGERIFWLGLAVVMLSFIPYLILGTGSYVTYYEQLDWGLPTYIYQAKYLFSGSDFIPEFLNGAGKLTMVAPAPAYVLAFRVLPTFSAYLFILFFQEIVSYIGMYLLLGRFVSNEIVKVLVSLTFAFLPVIPVLGLSIMGVPFAAWAIWNLYEGKKLRTSFFCIVLFTACSSLVLGGFALLMVWVVMIFFVLLRKRKANPLFFISFGVVTLEYLVLNARLILQMLGIGDGYVSHRAGMELEAEAFWSYFKYILLNNDNAATDLHRYWMPIVIVTACLSLFRYRRAKEEERHQARQLLSVILFLLCLYAFATFWNIEPIIALREKLGGIGSFQATRVIWLTPTCWYLALAISADYWLCHIHILKKWLWIPAYLGLCAAFLFVLKNNQIKENVQLLRNPEYHVITYENYYAIDLMDQIEEYIRAEFGLDMEEYRVISLGIDPSAALAHGFYCMDGYSNNYDLEYKNLFRTFIAPELDRNEYIRSYYDDWGNHVYLFTAELTTYVNVEKGSFWFNDLQIDTAAIKEAGCDFIISAAYVVNAEEENMELLATFETEESYYRLYLYQIG